jgi:BlaI family transcriptional regulator, penicillinase repressor
MAKSGRDQRLDLPPLELECMQALWARGEATVHEIRAELFNQRPLAYTTVMTVMDRLARKGVVDRRKRGRAHVYRPAISEAEVRERALGRLVENFFRGSREELRRHLEGGEFPSAPAAVEREPDAKPVGGTGSASHAEPAESVDASLL